MKNILLIPYDSDLVKKIIWPEQEWHALAD